MTKHALTIVPLLLLSSTAYSQQQSQTATYYCVAEWAGGGWFNSATERWAGTSFNINSLNSKFILKARPVGSRNSLQVLALQQDSYYLTITPSGSAPQFDCLGGNASRAVAPRLGRIECRVGFHDYIFNFESNRFLQVHAAGYLDDKDSNDDAPFISGGTCTKKE